MKTVFLFPGQGAQYPGMAMDLYEESAGVRSLFELASDTTKIDVHRLLSQGTPEELKETVNTQVSITVANLASAIVLREKGIDAQGAAGFSLGEFAALVESGVLSAEQVFPLVRLRGEAMAVAASKLDRSAGDPGMAAVLGLSPEKIEEILKNASIPDLFGANYNSPTQVVISGTATALQAADGVFKAAGAKRIITLKVSGPFHSPLLQPAASELAAVLENFEFRDPSKDLFSNVTGALVKTGREAKSLAIKQVTSPVRWTDEEASIIQAGYLRAIEVGPGNVLNGLWKSISTDIPCLSAGKLEQIREFV